MIISIPVALVGHPSFSERRSLGCYGLDEGLKIPLVIHKKEDSAFGKRILICWKLILSEGTCF